MPDDTARELLRRLPKVDDLLRLPALVEELARRPRATVIEAVRAALDELRTAILAPVADPSLGVAIDGVAFTVIDRLKQADRPGLRRCINATGILLHTGLGRAPLADEAIEAIRSAAGGCNLELDLATNERGDRTAFVEALLARVAGAEAAAVCNNNAAATLLLLNTLAEGREVIVSRGQLVEIGGSFRLPEVMEKSGCKLREVGTTNRTRASDYEKAITDRTAAIMLVHTSNFAVVGFTEQAGVEELAALAHRRGIKMIDDIGSGLLSQALIAGGAPKSLRDEPAADRSLAAGADVVCFSGDKLLGGPQAGILLGRMDTIAAIRRNPFMRAMRCDKLTLSALEATLRLHADPETARRRIPFWRMVSESEDTVRDRANTLAARLKAALPSIDIVVAECAAYAGGGSLPTEEIPSWSVAIDPTPMSCERFAQRLRTGAVPVLGRIRRERLVLDTRTLGDADLADAVAAVGDALAVDHL